MKVYVSLLACLIAIAAEARAQQGGNVVYSRGNRAEANRRLVREPVSLGAISLPDNSGMIIPAHVQINVRADEYVAVFGLSQEGRTIQDCNQKLNAQIENFNAELKNIGAKVAVDVDHTTQTRTYDYQLASNVATESATGFMVKRTVSIHYREKDLIAKLTAVAAKSGVYDLIKVDYLVNDAAAVRNKLLEEAVRIIKEKTGRYDNLLGLKFRSQFQIAQEKYDTIFPTEAYDSYTAFESGGVSESVTNDQYRVKEARKSETFFFNAQNPGDFDYIINPVVTEPVAQFSIYLQLKYLFDK
jgi:uncharacterized protein YggE